MWSKSEAHTPGQGQAVASGNASQAAYKGALRAKAKAALVGTTPGMASAPLAPTPSQNFKSHIAMAGAHAGVPLNTDDIHGAIAGLTQAGTFTPQQGAALIQHNGPLAGAAGAQTMHTITHAAINKKTTRPPMLPSGGPGAPMGAAPGAPPPGAPPMPPRPMGM